jgi:DNA-binding response OmpR family regulator
VQPVLSGRDCLERTSKEDYDLIILDIRMPEMDGWTTLRKLRERKVTDRTKIIILTVEKGPGVEIFGLQDVVADYITKPFDRERLIKHVRKALA